MTSIALLPGLGGTAATMAPLADVLGQHGVSTTSLTLPGHGGTEHDLASATWQQWLAAVPEADVLVGQSMGATLALAAAAARGNTVRGVVAINPALADADAAEGLEWQHSRGLEWLDAPDSDDDSDEADRQRIPVTAVLQMAHGALALDPATVTVPVVLAIGALDDTTDPWSLDDFAARLGGEVSRLELPGSGHVATSGPDLHLLVEPIRRLVARMG